MALNIRGIQPLSWGNVSTTGYLTESISDSKKTDESITVDDGGDPAIQVTGFGIRNDVTLEVIPKDATVAPEPGDVFTYGPSPGTLITVITIDKKTMSKDVEKWSIKGNYFPNIDLS